MKGPPGSLLVRTAVRLVVSLSCCVAIVASDRGAVPAAVAPQQTPQHPATNRPLGEQPRPAPGTPETPAVGADNPDLPRFEISVSYFANLVHWVDNLAGSSRGKTIFTYRKYWQARYGEHTPGEMDRLRRWEAIRAKPQSLPHPLPRIETGCLPQVADSPGWRQSFLLRSYEADSIGAFVDSLSDQLDDAERSDLRSILEAFEPRFAKIWQGMSYMKEFEADFRRYIDRSGLRAFLGEVARFLGVRPGEFPPGKLHLMALPEESVTFATAIGRDLMMEIRPGDGPEDQVQVISHETAHYLWQMMPPERVDALATQIHSASQAGPVIWAMMREGLPTAIGQGLADARLVPRSFGFQFPWYHLASIDRFAKEIYPLLDEALTKRQTIDQGFLPRIALGGAGTLAASAAPSDYLTEALHAVGQEMLPAYSQLLQQRPVIRRWLYPATDTQASAFLERYTCLGGLVLLGPAEAADPQKLGESLRPPGLPLRSGVYATRRPGGAVLFHLVASREEDIPRVADLFMRLRRIPDAPLWLDPIEP